MKIPAQLQTWTLACAGPLLCVWAFVDSRFRDAEDYLDAIFMLPVAIALACGVLAWSASKPWRNSGAWLSLAIAGQAAALQLIDAGARIHYQHYKMADLLSASNLLPLTLVGLQTLIVAAATLRYKKPAISWMRTTLGLWQIAAIAISLVIFSATLSPSIPFYVSEFLFAGFIQFVNLANFILVIYALPETTTAGLKQQFNGWFGNFDDSKPLEPGNVDRFAIILALFVTILATILSLFAYERHPHLADEVVYLFHAKYLAQGFLTLPLPPVWEAFNMDLMMFEEQRWYCPVPPGWPAILAVGSYFGVPWLVNPLLAGVSVLLASMLLRELFNKGLARLILLLFALSPWQIFLAMSFLTHTASLVTTLLSALAVARMRRTHSFFWALIGGCALGVTSWIRPLEGLAVAVLLGFWCLGIKGWGAKFKLIPVYVLTTMIVGAAILPYNKYLTGDVGKFPIMAYTDKYYGEGSNSLGFGPEKGLGWGAFDPFPGHGLLDVLINNNLNFFSVNIELFGWSSGSLFLVVALLLSGRMRRQDYWMLSVLVMIVGLHCLYWFSGGPDFGARYWYLTLLPWIVLTVRGLLVLTREMTDKSITQLTSFILVLSLTASVNFLPWRAIDKYHHYRNMRSDIRSLAQQNDFSSSLVLIQGERDPDYMSAAAYNTPTPNSDSPIYAWDRNPEIRSQLLQAFPERNIWLIEGPSLTGAGYRIVKGPISAKQLYSEAVNMHSSP